jgi:hypothetical protein
MLSRISPQPNHFAYLLLLVLSQIAPRRIATLQPPTDHREARLLKQFYGPRQKLRTAFGAHSLNPKLAELGHARGVKHVAARRTFLVLLVNDSEYSRSTGAKSIFS